MPEVNDNYTALPNEYLAELIDWLLGHGMTKVADDLADRMEAHTA